jgi:hypothetical protein
MEVAAVPSSKLNQNLEQVFKSNSEIFQKDKNYKIKHHFGKYQDIIQHKSIF